MKLYLLSDDNTFRTRWMNALNSLTPIPLLAFSPDIDAESIIFVLDTVIENLKESEIKELFLRRVMVFSMMPDFMLAQKYLQMGAVGYGNAMMHESHLHSVYQALEEGNVWLHPDFITMLISQIQHNGQSKKSSFEVLNPLSQRERGVALLLGDGKTHQEIADALDITVRTVKAHATSIYQKLDVKDRLALSLLLHT